MTLQGSVGPQACPCQVMAHLFDSEGDGGPEDLSLVGQSQCGLSECVLLENAPVSPCNFQAGRARGNSLNP